MTDFATVTLPLLGLVALVICGLGVASHAADVEDRGEADPLDCCCKWLPFWRNHGASNVELSTAQGTVDAP